MKMELYSGQQIDPLQLHPDEVRLGDIAHSLSMQCRYLGHCDQFYSIAQHAVFVARHLPTPRLQLFGLLHDAAEAYIGDIISPLKTRLFASIQTVERDILRTIYTVLCDGEVPSEREWKRIKEVDTRTLITEASVLMVSRGRQWEVGVQPYDDVIVPQTPESAKWHFLATYDGLKYDSRRQ